MPGARGASACNGDAAPRLVDAPSKPELPGSSYSPGPIDITAGPLKLSAATARSLPQTDLVVHPKRRISMNQDIISGKWKQMRGQVKQWWGKLTDDDLDRIDGAMDRLAGTLQERYGWEREEAERQIQKHFEEPDAERRGSSRR
jgi:uncharacterized protein YjbJ (UPF0337 family)